MIKDFAIGFSALLIGLVAAVIVGMTAGYIIGAIVLIAPIIIAVNLLRNLQHRAAKRR